MNVFMRNVNTGVWEFYYVKTTAVENHFFKSGKGLRNLRAGNCSIQFDGIR